MIYLFMHAVSIFHCLLQHFWTVIQSPCHIIPNSVFLYSFLLIVSTHPWVYLLPCISHILLVLYSAHCVWKISWSGNKWHLCLECCALGHYGCVWSVALTCLEFLAVLDRFSSPLVSDVGRVRWLFLQQNTECEHCWDPDLFMITV